MIPGCEVKKERSIFGINGAATYHAQGRPMGGGNVGMKIYESISLELLAWVVLICGGTQHILIT